MGSLYHLPNELVAHILLFCAFKDVLSCQSTCRFLHEIITTSSIIQYSITLEISGLEDNPQCELSIPERLRLLQRREASWALFQPNFIQEIPVKNTAVVIYELSGGTYLLSGISRDSINHLRLPSAPSDAVPSWDHIPVTDELLDFGLAVTEHDLIGVLTTSTNDVASTLQIRFLQLSTGLPHPLSGSPMRFTQHILTDNLGVGIEIVGNLAALVVRDVSFGHNNRDKLLVLDWKRGIVRAELYVESRRYQSAIFLTPDILLITNAHERCLEIWRIPFDSGDSAPIICRKPELSLGLPIIHPGFMVSEFACRGAPNPISSNHDTSRPFQSSSIESIMVFHLTISPLDPRVPIPFVFFAHRRTFLELLFKARLKPESRMMVVPWSEWGPPKTRWLRARSIPTEWITTTSGQRYAYVSTHAPALPQPVIVLDFNQNHVRKVIANMKNQVHPYHGVLPNEMMITTTDMTALSRRIWIDESRDTYEKMKVFAEDVGGHLPYVAVKSAQTYDFHGVLMDDERIIGIKRNHVLSGVESIEVIHMG